MSEPAIHYRTYWILEVTADLPAAVTPLSLNVFEILIRTRLFPVLGIDEGTAKKLRIASVPTLDWKLEVKGRHDNPPAPDRFVVAFDTPDPEAFDVLERRARAAVGKEVLPGTIIVAEGEDPGGGNADHWCPG